jgi:hypothetical protein
MTDGGASAQPGKQTLVEGAPQGAAPAGGQSENAKQEPDWVVRARAYHKAHAALCEQFLQATSNACVGANGELDPAEVARWQVAHGLDPDGRIGPMTVKAAQGKGAGAAAVAGAGAGAEATHATGAGAAAGHAGATPAPAAAAGGQGEQGGFMSTLSDMGQSILDWFSGNSSHGGGGGGGGGGGSGGGSGGGGAHDTGGGGGGGAGDHDLPVPEHADDVNTPEQAPKKPPTAPAKPVGKEVYEKGGILSKEHLGHYNLSEQEYQFKLKVYDAAVARLGEKIYGGVPKEDLVSIEGGKLIRKDVVGPLNSMLSVMRADMQAGKAIGDKAVGNATGIAVTSAYRSPEHDRDLWDSYFQNYLAKTAADRAATGDPFGAEAVKLIVKYIGSRKAPPGGSNHSNGIAVDLSIEENGHRLGNSYDNQSAWKKSWQYAWLNANAATYGFKNYPKEAWHWDHKL